MALNQALNALFSGGGVVASYTIFSILQEEITRDSYGPTKEKFVYMQELVWILCVSFCVVAFFLMPRGRSAANVATVPWYYYAAAAASYTIAMVSSNTALEFVPYPTQVLCKSCKPLPILISGALFAGKRYPLSKYFNVTLIVLGMAIFMYKPKHSGKFDLLNFGKGEALLLLSLAMDGVTGTIQEWMKSGFKVEKYSMMFYMNLFSGIFLSSTILISNDLMKFVDFTLRYPQVIQRIAFLAAAGTCGQIFIFKTVSDFGPLSLSIITTSRKLISVVLSVIIFANPFTQYQLWGTLVVFSALFYDGYVSSRNKAAKPSVSKAPSAPSKKEISETSEEDDFERVPQTVDPTPSPPPSTSGRRRVRKE